MKEKWNDIMELDFEQLLEGKEYDAANNAVFELVRTAYMAGYQRARWMRAETEVSPVEPDRKP